jgi:hypothetical protein
MPNYQLPEIPGGVVYVPVEDETDYKLISFDEIGRMTITPWLKPIPVTPVKDVDCWNEILDELPRIVIGAPLHEPERRDYIIRKLESKYTASLKEKGGEGCQS